MTAFTYDQLDRMLRGGVHIDLPCPVCGPNARLPFNRRRKVFRLWNPRPGFISWDCRRCGIKGGIGDGSTPRPVPTIARIERERQADDAALDTMHYAQSLFQSGRHLKDTPAEIYLNSRAISLERAGDLSHVMRFASVLPLDGKRVCGIVSLFRDIRTNEPRGIHRIFLHPDGRPVLDADGSKIKRMLGPAAGAAIKLDPDEDVTIGLHIGPGGPSCNSFDEDMQLMNDERYHPEFQCCVVRLEYDWRARSWTMATVPTWLGCIAAFERLDPDEVLLIETFSGDVLDTAYAFMRRQWCSPAPHEMRFHDPSLKRGEAAEAAKRLVEGWERFRRTS